MTTEKTFNDFALPETLVTAIHRMQFKTPTPIQLAAIPTALHGKDLVGSAQTGSGKTAAFLIPILARMITDPTLKALVLAPTRELAVQISEVFRDLRPTKEFRSAVLIGGASMGRQVDALQQNPAIIIATPGRLNDHLNRKTLNVSKVKIVVLDEVDRMLDMGFLPQVEEAFQYLPKKRQTLLFSATLPGNIRKLIERHTQNAEYISVGSPNTAAVKIKQTHIQVAGADKNQRILEEIQARSGPILIFARTKLRTDRLAKYLKANGVKTIAIHGGRTQRQRQDALKGFLEERYPVLVATDVASRGIDVPSIKLVVNFDLPETSDDYIHRIGRTARAGAEGEALSLVTPEETSHWNYLTKGGTDRNKNDQKPKTFQPKKKRFGFGAFAGRFQKKFGQKNRSENRSDSRSDSRGPRRPASSRG